MSKSILAFIFALSILYNANGQPDTLKSDAVYEKLYLHIDREIYSPGDDIWYKSYLVSGINHKLIPGFKNIYVQLISDEGEIAGNQLIMSVDGTANGDFRLSDSIPEGSYTIRAYTKYLLNFGEESIFHKRIAVSNPGNSLEDKEPVIKTAQIDAQFLPEGGNLVLNAANYIAFKVTDETGRGIPVSGKIVDEKGEEVVLFKTLYNGMGSFGIMPVEGKTYTALIDGYSGFSYRFEDPEPDGIAMHYEPDGSFVMFRLNRNIKSAGTIRPVLVASHKGEELFREEAEMTGAQYQMKIYKGFFPPGISKVTILDELDRILAERLIFIRNNESNSVAVDLGARTYEPHQKVEIDLTALLDSETDSINSTLSMAVVSQDYFSSGGRNQTIESYLLIDSELKGPVESSASLFTDEPGITAQEKLDLVMLVNGWRKYYWEEMAPVAGMDLPGWDDAGITVSGRVEKMFGNKPIENGIVELGPFSNLFVILKDTTDAYGRFSFDRLYLKDTAQIMINATNSRGSNYVEVFNETTLPFDTIIPFAEVSNATMNFDIPDRFYRASYYKHLAEREYELEHGTILLEGVDVIRDKMFYSVFIKAQYGWPNQTYELKDDAFSYTNILDYVETNIPAVYYDYSNQKLTYRNQSIRLLLDGFGISTDELESVPIGDIAFVDFYKSSINIARFGSELGNSESFFGVLSFVTKSPGPKFYADFKRNIHGRIVPAVHGFKQSREFYSPVYPLADDMDSEKPDFRATMYWNPEVYMKDNKAKVEFFTSEMTGKYNIIVEGISTKGRIIYGTGNLEVVVPVAQ